MNTFRKGLDLLLGAICCLVLAIMVGIACWQVVSRYILGVPSTLTEEMLRFLCCKSPLRWAFRWGKFITRSPAQAY